MLFSAREHLASHWLDLAEGRLRLDRLNRNGGGENFFPWGCPPPAILRCAAAQGVRRRSPSAFRSPSRPRWSRARKQQGEVTWLTSALSRNPARNSRARSSP